MTREELLDFIGELCFMLIFFVAPFAIGAFVLFRTCIGNGVGS